MVFNIISVFLQYSLIVLIYYFLYIVVKLIYADLRQLVPTRKRAEDTYHSLKTFKPQLVVLNKGHVEMDADSYELNETTTIGRSTVNDIVVDDKFVSHEHACITHYNNGYWLTDLNSTNKTYLNEQPVAGEILLTDGDSIKVGAVTFKFGR